jgi:Amt family ammonium transporter
MNPAMIPVSSLPSPTQYPEFSLLLCLGCVMLVPLAAAGLGLIHQGLGRSRSAAHAMLATLCALSIAAILTVAVGYSWAVGGAAPAHTFTAGGAQWDWLGRAPFFAGGVSFQGAEPAALAPALKLCLLIFAAGLAAMPALSAGTDRWRLGASCSATALLAALFFPLFAHWTWGGGWLAQLDANFHVPAFIDAGGAGVIQVVGGLMAVCVAWITGARRGKYAEDGIPAAIPGHNIVQVLFGCMLALVGWIGLDSAASILFYSAGPQQIAAIVVNAMLAASSGCLAAVAITRLRYRKPDASMSANGWIAGLVAGSAACAMVSPLAAIDIGAIAGVLVTYMVEIAELRLQVDDPGGAVSVHVGAGLWGLIAVGLFGHFAPVSGHFDSASHAAHLLAQMVGIGTLLGLMLPLLYGANMLLNRVIPYRVDNDGDWQGMDIRELGAGAYPEFVVHADDFVPR